MAIWKEVDVQSRKPGWAVIVAALIAGKIPMILQWRPPGAWFTLGFKAEEEIKKGVTHWLEPITLPKIVCLCGSTRFKDAFDEANYQETMAGRIVLSVGFFMHATGNKHGESIGATPEQKTALDELHKRKIDLADDILVLNVDGYIGESTRSEIEYAVAHGKPVRYLEAQ